MPHDRRPYDYVKRGVDVCASAAGLIVTAPIQAAVALVVCPTHGKPVSFRQVWPGRNGQIFELVKFRTMLHADESNLTAEERLTATGKVLRSTSLDELPTLWNALKGDMSIIGPRPLLISYHERYTPTQARRHEVRPGVTGLAQALGRNTLGWEERFELGVQYVDNRSLLLDLKVLFWTVHTVLRSDGISAPGYVTLPVFEGRPVKETE